MEDKYKELEDKNVSLNAIEETYKDLHDNNALEPFVADLQEEATQEQTTSNKEQNSMEGKEEDTGALEMTDKLDLTRNEERKPKRKKRRYSKQSGDKGSLQDLLHVTGSRSASGESELSADLSEGEQDLDSPNVQDKWQGNKRKLQRKSERHLYIQDEAEEDEELNDESGVSDNSSSEDDDEDGYDELKDFIVDEVDEEIEEPIYNRKLIEGEEQETPGEEENESLDDDDDEILQGELEEDDLDLIEENTGIKLKADGVKHRLKKLSETVNSGNNLIMGKNINDLEQQLFHGDEDYDDFEKDGRHINLKQSTYDSRVTLYDGDDEYDEYDEDSWMVDDSGGRVNISQDDSYNLIQSVFGDYQTVLNILMNKVVYNNDNSSSSYGNTKQRARLETIKEDSTNTKDVLEEEGEIETIQDQMKRTVLDSLQETVEPGELQSQTLTEFDSEIKLVDIPERLYLLYHYRWKSMNDKRVEKDELLEESQWIANKFVKIYRDIFKEDIIRRNYSLIFKTSFPYHVGSVVQNVANAIYKVLDWLLNDRLDLPFIFQHRIHLVQPPLNEFFIGKIILYDSIYYKIKTSMNSLYFNLLSYQNILSNKKNKQGIATIRDSNSEDQISNNLDDTSTLDISSFNDILSMCRDFDSFRDVDKIRNYIMYHLDTPRWRRSVGLDPTKSPEGELFLGSNKKRRNFTMELFYQIENDKIYEYWGQYIVSPQILSIYMKSFVAPQFRCSVPTGITSNVTLLPPDGPTIENTKSALYKWFDKFTNSKSPYFITSEKMIESLIIYEAKRLATYPPIRTKIKDFFLANICITTVTTVKGEKTLNPSNPSWIAKRLYRHPINALLTGTYLPVDDGGSGSSKLLDGCLASEIFELERLGLIDVVIHPLCIDDEAPWRGEDGENKMKERFMHEVPLLSNENYLIQSNSSKTPLPSPILSRFEQEFCSFRSSDNMDNRIIGILLDELKYGFVSISGSIWSRLIQIPILHRLVEKELFPIFRQHTVELLKSRADEYIAELCYHNLSKRLNFIAPRRPVTVNDPKKQGNHNDDNDDDDDDNDDDNDNDNDDNDDKYNHSELSKISRIRRKYRLHEDAIPETWGLEVISCVIDKAKNGYRTYIVVLDIHGEMRDYLILNFLFSIQGSGKSTSNLFNNKNFEIDADSRRREEEIKNLVEFTKIYYPHYIGIGLSDKKALELSNIWNNEILTKISRYQKRNHVPQILMISMDVPRALTRNTKSIKSESRLGNKNKDEYPTALLMAISVGRLIQNPLAEQLQLWDDSCNEVERELASISELKGTSTSIANTGGLQSRFNNTLSLRLHRFQSKVDIKLLQFHLLLAIRLAVANIGVQINRIKGHDHLQSPLKFVGGFGIRKARILIHYLDSNSSSITNKIQLQLNDEDETFDSRNTKLLDEYDDYLDRSRRSVGCLSRNVLFNSLTFLRVDDHDYGFNALRDSSDSNLERKLNNKSRIPIKDYEDRNLQNMNIFDISRLHELEDKELVTTILGNIQDQNDPKTRNGKASSGDHLLSWDWIRERNSKLEVLDMEAYAKLMYENQDKPRLLPYLNRIQKELQKPYDITFYTREFRGVEKYRQHREIMNISDEDLYVGCEISCRVTGILHNKGTGSRFNSYKCPVMFWHDQYNLKIVVEDFDMFWNEILDENPSIKSATLESLFVINSPILGIVSNLDQNQHCIYVVLSQKKICDILNYSLDQLWRNQQYYQDNVKHYTQNLSSSVFSQDSCSSLLWSDIRHFAFILFKKNYNLIFNNYSRNAKSSKSVIYKGDTLDIYGSAKLNTSSHAIHRTIHHPNYRSWSHERIVEYLESESIVMGETIIRPSNTAVDKLNMYIKVSDKPFMYKITTIEEYDQRLPGELGRKLKIDNTEYNDIDQILIQYVHPLKIHLNDVYNHSKYRRNMEYQNMVTELLLESTRSGNSIVWGIVMDKQIPCRFHLVSVPPNNRVGPSGARIHFEDGIYVNNKGFQLWRKTESTLRKLLNWWKTDGFFKRNFYLEDYKKYKQLMVKQKQNNEESMSHSHQYKTSYNGNNLQSSEKYHHFSDKDNKPIEKSGYSERNSGFGDRGYRYTAGR
ncbi:hypothetical protein ACR3K2_09660 [Cryptosporidium serpentis]